MSDDQETTASVYETDILSQPDKLRAIDLDAAAEARARLATSEGLVVLTGMGASLAALRPLWLAMVAGGRPAILIETSELLASALPLLGTGTLMIVASQSGRSAEIVVAAEEAAGRRCPILAVTNDLSSPLAGMAGLSVDIAAGAEAAVSTKTFLNTLAVCHVLGSADASVAADEVARTAHALDAMLADRGTHVAAIEAAFGAADRLFYLGRGRSLAAATYGALISKEAAKWPVEAMSVPQFRHGPMELVDGRVAALILAGDRESLVLNKALSDDIRRFGGQSLWLGEDGEGPFRLPPTDGTILPILEAIPLQLATLALARRSGVPAGVFRHLAKVTTEL